MQKSTLVKIKHSSCIAKSNTPCNRISSCILNPISFIQRYVITNGENASFNAWLQSKGEAEACSSLLIRQSSHGRGLFAARPILAGECILRISRKLVITPDNLHDKLKVLMKEDVSDCSKLALLILSEQYAGQLSEWAPYMNCLPQSGALHNTVLWKDDELELLRQSSSAYRQSIQSRTAIFKEFETLQNVFQQCPHVFGQSVTRSRFLHAYAVVNSRAWGVDDGNTLGLVPFVDFLNHNGSCQSFLVFDDDYNYAEVIADRDYAYGEQVFVSYGDYGNDMLARMFGFTLELNPHDQVEIWMGLSKGDVLYNQRLELLISHGMLMQPMFEGSDDQGSFFLVSEVKTMKGRGKGIPQSLRALARVLCADSHGELVDMAKDAAQLDGRLARKPLKDGQKELRAMMLLRSHLESLILDYKAAISGLNMAWFCKSSKDSTSSHYIRRNMAKDVLHGELRILRSASDWLHNYCISIKSVS